jgi:hypothetical protein
LRQNVAASPNLQSFYHYYFLQYAPKELYIVQQQHFIPMAAQKQMYK